MNLKDSGERREFETGAQRDRSSGKGRMDLLPFRALIELSKLLEAGALKYGDRNWERGMPIQEYIDSGLRHISKFMSGRRDEPHLVQAAWNLMCALDTLIRIQEGELPESLLDGLPHKETVKVIWEKPVDKISNCYL